MFARLPDKWIRYAVDGIDAGVLIESAGSIAYMNDAYAKLLGVHAGDTLIGRPVDEIVAPADRERLRFFAQRRQERRNAPTAYEFQAMRHDGQPVALTASVSIRPVPGSMLITTTVQVAHAPAVQPWSEVEGLSRLSPRERQVFEQLLAGKRPKEIAHSLGVSEKTIATHRARMNEKLALRSSLDLFCLATKHGLLPQT